uniref:peptidylprolyl isomerase n=1 Tax=Cannabis sativa TaxID=3483 RepID=A0A803PWQ6_CANSA
MLILWGIVLKKTLKEGEGYERPNDGTVVQVKLTGKLHDGIVFTRKCHDDGKPYEFKIDEEQVIDGLDLSCKEYEERGSCFGDYSPRLAKLKLKDYKQAEKFCTKVLDLDSKNVKALYRRAQAYIQLVDLDLAEIDIKKALEIEPDNM